MIISCNLEHAQTILQPLFCDHGLQPLWLNDIHTKTDMALWQTEDYTQAKAFRQHYHGLFIIAIADEANIHAYLSLQPFYILRQAHLNEDLQTLTALLEQYLNEQYATISVRLGASSLQLAVSSITYIESFSHYLTLHSTHGQYTLRQNMQKLENELKGFIRVHKSYLVAIREIAEIQSTQLILKDHTVIPIGRTYKKMLAQLKLF